MAVGQSREALDKWARIVYQISTRDQVDFYGKLIVINYCISAKE